MTAPIYVPLYEGEAKAGDERIMVGVYGRGGCKELVINYSRYCGHCWDNRSIPSFHIQYLPTLIEALCKFTGGRYIIDNTVPECDAPPKQEGEETWIDRERNVQIFKEQNSLDKEK